MSGTAPRGHIPQAVLRLIDAFSSVSEATSHHCRSVGGEANLPPRPYADRELDNVVRPVSPTVEISSTTSDESFILDSSDEGRLSPEDCQGCGHMLGRFMYGVRCLSTSSYSSVVDGGWVVSTSFSRLS